MIVIQQLVLCMTSFDFVTAWMRRGILTIVIQYSTEVCFVQSYFVASVNTLEICFFETVIYILNWVKILTVPPPVNFVTIIVLKIYVLHLTNGMNHQLT